MVLWQVLTWSESKSESKHHILVDLISIIVYNQNIAGSYFDYPTYEFIEFEY
jgi:hypothetical protein